MKSDYKFRMLAVSAGRLRWPPAAAAAVAGGSGSRAAVPAAAAARGTPGRPGVFQPSSNFDAMCVSAARGHGRPPGHGHRPEQLAALLDQRATTSGTAKSWIAIPRCTPPQTIFRCSRPPPPRLQASPRTSSTSPTTPTCGRRFRRAESRQAMAPSSRSSPAHRRAGSSSPITEPGLAAAGQLSRGDEILQVDGADAVNGGTQAIVDTLNAGLFPGHDGRDPHLRRAECRGRPAHGDADVGHAHACAGAHRHHVQHASGPVGYIQFNDHIATAEAALRRDQRSCDNAERHRSHPRPALQRRRLSRSRERARIHDRQHHADRRPHVRADRVQRQVSEPQSGHRRDPHADAVPHHVAGFLRHGPRTRRCRR